jgi:hypothetical protein
MDTARAREVRALLTLVSVLAAYVIPGSHSWSGPVLLVLTPTHGVHLADLAVVALGLLVVLRAQRAGLLDRPAAARQRLALERRPDRRLLTADC